MALTCKKKAVKIGLPNIQTYRGASFAFRRIDATLLLGWSFVFEMGAYFFVIITLKFIGQKQRTTTSGITRADEGGIIVILDQSDYDRKVMEFINLNGD